MMTSSPNLRGVLLRVPDPDACRPLYEDVLGCRVDSGPFPGWLTLDTGWGQLLWLAPGGRMLPALTDRWERQGVIPILRTFDLDRLVSAADHAGIRWINRVFNYQMLGTGHLGYLPDPAGQPIGIQARGADSVRAEDTAAEQRRQVEAAGSTAGLGWLILQAADIDGARDFYARALGWTERRGTKGFGYMHEIDDVTTLQIAFRGRKDDPARDLTFEPAIPVVGGAAAVPDGFLAHGGSVAESPVGGLVAMTDPEGTAWLLDPADVLGSAAGVAR